MDRGVWQATVHRVTKNQTQLAIKQQQQRTMSNNIECIRQILVHPHNEIPHSSKKNKDTLTYGYGSISKTVHYAVRKIRAKGLQNCHHLCKNIYITYICIGGASLVVQMVKNLPAMWETRVRSLGCEDPLKRGKAIHTCMLAKQA